MQNLTIAGNVGNVKEVREVNGDKVLNFSIAVDNGKDKNGERRESTWFECSMWGKRAESLALYIEKGSKLVVSGRPSARAHEGKAYLGITVNELTFMSSKSSGGSSDDGYSQKPSSSYDLSDEVPF